jgi:hypothetical protein
VLAPQPRLSTKVKVKVARGVAWISAFGVAHQEPTDEAFVPNKLPDPIETTSRRSYQASEAVEVQAPARIRIRVTGFTTLLAAPAWSEEERSGGLEVFLHREFAERLRGFVSYTLSRAVETIGSVGARSSGDSTHLLSAAVGYDLGMSWRVGIRFFFRSGRPYTLACETRDCSPGESQRLYTVSVALPAFYRVDARVEKRWAFAGGRWLAATLEAFNALAKGEATSAVYTPESGLAPHVESPIVLPSLGLEGGF